MNSIQGDATAAPDGPANALCFLLDEDFIFRQDFAKELRRRGVEVVEFSNSSRFMDMVDDQSPDIVFINLNSASPRECIRALMTLKECEYSGAVQLFGRCERRILEDLNGVAADCSLAVLPPITKPIKFETVYQIIRQRKAGSPTNPSAGISLNDALTRNLVRFLYQPKLDLKTHKMVGAEVFARVVEPTLGLLTPEQFLKGADEDDLLKLSRLALVSALKASVRFQELGISLRLAINLSTDNLLRLPICDLILMHRPQCGEWPGLTLEVPERQVISKIELLKARSVSLQQSGVSITIDNFGCGSSCLGKLSQIPFSEMKIDRSLVEGCATNQGKLTICKTLIQVAHNFGSQAVAVGVSMEADLRALEGLECDIGQGFLLGKPMSIDQIHASNVNSESRAKSHTPDAPLPA